MNYIAKRIFWILFGLFIITSPFIFIDIIKMIGPQEEELREATSLFDIAVLRYLLVVVIAVVTWLGGGFTVVFKGLGGEWYKGQHEKERTEHLQRRKRLYESLKREFENEHTELH